MLKHGQPAQAVILETWDTGVTINQAPQVGLLLEVRPYDRSPYQVKTRVLVSRLNPGLYQPGLVVKMRYDPQETKPGSH